MDRKKMLEPRLLETLYNVRTVGRSKIAKYIATKLNIDTRTAINKLKLLYKLRQNENFRLTVEYYMSKLNLKVAMIITDYSREELASKAELRFLRSVTEIVPSGYAYSFYVPKDFELLSNLPSEVANNVNDVVEIHERIRNRTLTSLYGVDSLMDLSKALGEDSFVKLKNYMDKVFSDYYVGDSLMLGLEDVSRVRFDAIDLGIIKELEKDPLASLSEIASSLGIPLGKVRRHASEHIPYLVRGIRVMSLPIYDKVLGCSFMVVIKSRDVFTVARVLEGLVTHPLFASAGLRLDRGEGVVFVVSPFFLVKYLLKFLELLGMEWGFEVVSDRVRLMLLSFTGKYTIPYRKWEEYVPKMSWNVEDLKKIFRGGKSGG